MQCYSDTLVLVEEEDLATPNPKAMPNLFRSAVLLSLMGSLKGDNLATATAAVGGGGGGGAERARAGSDRGMVV